MKHKIIRSLAIGGIAFLAIILPQMVKAQIKSAEMPLALQPCIPSQVSSLIKIAETRNSGTVYSLFKGYIDQSGTLESYDLVISRTNDSCQTLFFDPLNHSLSFTPSLPSEVAYTLSKAQIEQIVAKIGREVFQQNLFRASAGQPVFYWPAVEIEVLQDLGFQIPDNFQPSSHLH